MALPPEHRPPAAPTATEQLAQIVAFATLEAIEAGFLDRFLHRLLGAIRRREGMMPPRRIGDTS